MDAGQEVKFTYPSASDGVEVTIEGVVHSVAEGVVVVEEKAAYSVWGHSNSCVGTLHVVDEADVEPTRLASYARNARTKAHRGVSLHSKSELAANIRDELMAPAKP